MYDIYELSREFINLMPKINEMLLKQKGFQYAASLDLNMGYYHI